MNIINLIAVALILPQSPYVRVSNVGPIGRTWSGVVIKETEETYQILTCAHGVDDLPKNNVHLQVDFMVSGSYNYISTPATLLKKDIDRDLALIECNKVEGIAIAPVGIGDQSTTTRPCYVYGFAGRGKLISKQYSFKSVDAYTGTNGEKLLTLNGKAISGFSGGAVISDSKIIGIQSSGTDTVVTCSTVEQINSFLSD